MIKLRVTSRTALATAGLPAGAVLVTLAATASTGGLSADVIPGLPDAGQLTRVLLPAAQILRDLAAIVTAGTLVLVACCLPPEDPKQERSASGARGRLVAVAQLIATAWVGFNLALAVLVYSDASGARVGSDGFWRQAFFFARNYELGQYLLWGAALAAVVAVGCAFAAQMTSVGLVTVTALVGLWPVALTGHAAGTLDHDDAVNLQLFHLLAIAVWFGGLVALVLVHRRLGEHLVPTVRRFSTLAGWCLVVVTISGLLGAWLRLPGPGALLSSYGLLLILKLAAVVVLAAAGFYQRQRLIDRLAAGHRRAFIRLVAVELAVLAAAAGLGVALSRTAPPPPEGGEQPLTTAESLLGAPMPPALDPGRWLSAWSVDSLFLPLGVAALLWYLLAVRRLRRRGVKWSWLRTASWVVGCLLFIWATNGSPGVYGRVLFSMHMVQHMTIATAVPTFLVLGTPVTLALRTLRRRTDESRGPREWLLGVVHSLPAQLLGHPVVAAGLFVVGMVSFYYSSLFQASLESHTAHILMTFHFLLSGYLLAECVVGEDPGLDRPAYPMRALLVMITFGFHALFSVTLMANSTVLASDWFGALDRDWGKSLLDDQYLGASIGWGMGEYPLLVMAVALLVSWVRADQRERRRFDHSEDRDGGQRLAAYNAHLARLSEESTMGRSGHRTEEDEA